MEMMFKRQREREGYKEAFVCLYVAFFCIPPLPLSHLVWIKASYLLLYIM